MNYISKAASMTDEEFRATIYKRMKEAERQRRMQGSVGITFAVL